MEKREYKEFKNLLRNIIGEETQKEFAERVGISPEHLSRLLSKNPISQPSKKTLSKISRANPYASIAKLYTYCGYDETDVRLAWRCQCRDNGLDDAQDRVTYWMNEGLREIIRNHGAFADMKSFLEELCKSHVPGFIKASVFDMELESPGNMPKDTCKAACVRFVVDKPRDENGEDADGYYACDNYFIFTYVQADSGIFITDAALDGASLKDSGLLDSKLFAPFELEDAAYEDGHDIRDFTSITLSIEKKYKEGKSPEQRLLNIIFGEEPDDGNTMDLYHYECGYGSAWEKTPDGFGCYLLDNEKYFRESPEQCELMDAVIDLADKVELTAEALDELFRDWSFEGHNGCAGAAEYILRGKAAEEGLWFRPEFEESEEHADLLPPVLYVCEDWYTDGECIVQEKLNGIDRFMKRELYAMGLRTYGSVMVYRKHTYMKNDLVYQEELGPDDWKCVGEKDSKSE